ncbi:MAG: hypothetical protein JNK65_05715 [Deltaproteobacteria bacterium]|nr:hypothetical protein [Deltaproteobacteria bacterium]
MKTTLNISDAVMLKLKKEAAQRKCTLSQLVEMAFRLLLQPQPKSKKKMSSLPRFKSGGVFVNLADRAALYEAMEDRPCM